MIRKAVALVGAILLVGACSTPGATGVPGTQASGSSAPVGSASAGGTIKIGGGFALTGDESALDLPAANGAKLAVKQINAAGGVNGSQIDFIVHDSQYKMDVTAQTAKQFVEQDKVPLFIGYTDTDSVLASGP
ncbi:MAG TPA: ABC transporter substrate-binding protein, partial [Patescibacteria group bacterium]|nr:ABC transporter substrate-binding protein [Patescibacteria group bacterium]